jgi:hypothetical protein
MVFRLDSTLRGVAVSGPPEAATVRSEDFIVELGPQTARGVRVKARCVVAGEQQGWLRLPCPAREITARFAALVRGGASVHSAGAGRHVAVEPTARAPALDGWSAKDLGAALFEAVFSGPVGSLLDHSLGSLGRDDPTGLRIKLMLDLADPVQKELHGLPWELLYRARTGDLLGLSRRTPVVRYLELPRPVPPAERPETLRVLVVAAQPEGVAGLDLARECRDLAALAGSVNGLEVDLVEPASLGALRRALLEREAHVVHFMGHGRLEPETGRGLLVLERPDGRAEPVAADALAAVLKDFPSVRLVVLNACETARAGGGGVGQSFTGLAPALMQGGLAAVLAMQLPISDAGAIELSEAFYRRLAAGDPVDVAATEARQAMHAHAPGSAEWAVPVLFLRVPDGALFRLRTGRSEQTIALCTRSAAQLRAGRYDDAISALREGLTEAPDRGLFGVALGIGLARSRGLRRLPYRTAQEMHELFSTALASEESEALAAAALLALKADYFKPSSVREPPPSSAELLGLLDGASLTPAEAELLACLKLGDRARRALEEAGIDGERIR